MIAALAARPRRRRGDRGRAGHRHGQARRRHGRGARDARSQRAVGGADAAGVPPRGARTSAATSPPSELATRDRRRLADRARRRQGDRRGSAATRTSRSRPPLDLRARRAAARRALCSRRAPRESCLNRSPPVLTDYHLHLRPDDPDATSAEYFTRGERRALPRGGERARDRRAGGLRTRLPLRAGARGLAPPASGSDYAHDDLDEYCAFVREQTDLRLGHRGRLRPRRRGSDGEPAARRATSTTSSARCTSCATARVDMDDYSVWDSGAQRRGDLAALLRDDRRGARSGLFDIIAHPDLVKYWGPDPAAARPRGRSAPLLRARGRGDRRIGDRGRGLDGGAAQARRRDVPGAGVPARCASRRRAGRALERRPPPRGRRRGLRSRARAARRSWASRELCVFERRAALARADRQRAARARSSRVTLTRDRL